MRKLWLILVSLAVIGSHNAYADIISVPDFSADSGVPHLNYFKNTTVNMINGNIQGAGGTGANRNIAADSVAEIDLYDDANPRIYASDLLSIGSDSFATGTLVQNSYVKSGGTIATSGTLSSTLTACVYYVNGYRISLGASSQTFTASMDTYVDLSQSGVVTLSPVANGATQPPVASNSARVAKVVTDGTSITSVTDLANRRLPGLTVPANYRSGFAVSKDSATTLSILPGTCEINNTMLNKTSNSTLTISTSGDWAGGVSLRAADTYAFVGEDASGNLKLHTTAPAFSNYAVSSTAGKKRYSTWSGTVYRILGWFYMDGSQNVEVASNIKEGDVANIVVSNDLNIVALSSTSYVPIMNIRFYSSGNPVKFISIVSGDTTGTIARFENVFRDGSSDLTSSEKGSFALTAGSGYDVTFNNMYAAGGLETPSQSSHNYSWRAKVDGNAYTQRRRTFFVEES